MGSLELGSHSLLLPPGLLQLALQLLPFVVGEPPELLQLFPGVAGAPLQSLLLVQDLPPRAACLQMGPSPSPSRDFLEQYKLAECFLNPAKPPLSVGALEGVETSRLKNLGMRLLGPQLEPQMLSKRRRKTGIHTIRKK